MRATWKPHEKHGELTERGDLPSSVFAYPKKRKEPMTDASRVRNAVARFDQVTGVSDSERQLAFANIKKAARHFGVKMSESNWCQLGCRPSTGGARPPSGANRPRAQRRRARKTRHARHASRRRRAPIFGGCYFSRFSGSVLPVVGSREKSRSARSFAWSSSLRRIDSISVRLVGSLSDR
jgi:hypothetical protein